MNNNTNTTIARRASTFLAAVLTAVFLAGCFGTATGRTHRSSTSASRGYTSNATLQAYSKRLKRQEALARLNGIVGDSKMRKGRYYEAKRYYRQALYKMQSALSMINYAERNYVLNSQNQAILRNNRRKALRNIGVYRRAMNRAARLARR